MTTSKAIGLVEQVIKENENFYRKDVLDALRMSVDALYAIEQAEMIDILYRNEGLYFCDPDKNVTCTKETCFINNGPCHHTKEEKYKVGD